MCEFHNWLLIQAQGLDSSPDPAWFQKALSNMPRAVKHKIRGKKPNPNRKATRKNKIKTKSMYTPLVAYVTSGSGLESLAQWWQHCLSGQCSTQGWHERLWTLLSQGLQHKACRHFCALHNSRAW